MPRLLPALKFAFWTWVLTLLVYLAWLGVMALFPAQRMPAVYYAPQALALYLFGLTVTIGAAWLAPLLARLLTPRPLLLVPILTVPLLWLTQVAQHEPFNARAFPYLLSLLLVGAAFASLPDWLRSRRPVQRPENA